MDDLKMKTVPVINQPQDRFYKMSIRFRGDMGDKALDEMLGQCFHGETVSLKDAVVLHINQTVTFIPDGAALEKYAKALEAGYSTGNKIVRNVRFDGYEYLYMVEPENGQDGPCAYKQKKTARAASARRPPGHAPAPAAIIRNPTRKKANEPWDAGTGHAF